MIQHDKVGKTCNEQKSCTELIKINFESFNAKRSVSLNLEKFNVRWSRSVSLNE